MLNKENFLCVLVKEGDVFSMVDYDDFNKSLCFKTVEVIGEEKKMDDNDLPITEIEEKSY